MNRAELVAAAGETIRHGSKSFHMASRLFDRRTRERAWLLYCWCRHCDDVCDGQALGFRTDRAQGTVEAVELLTFRSLPARRRAAALRRSRRLWPNARFRAGSSSIMCKDSNSTRKLRRR